MEAGKMEGSSGMNGKMGASTSAMPAAAAAGSMAMGSGGTDHMVVVGGKAGLVFTPSVVEAKVNDTITFVFQSKNHTVTQSAFATPCTFLQDMPAKKMGFRSGFVTVSPDAAPDSMPRWTLRVDVATPLWFFCEQTTHCGKKMVGAVNPAKTGDKTFEAFQGLAEKQGAMGAPPPAAAPPPPTAATPPPAAAAPPPAAAPPAAAAPPPAAAPPAAAAPPPAAAANAPPPADAPPPPPDDGKGKVNGGNLSFTRRSGIQIFLTVLILQLSTYASFFQH
ncbi:hypothetical protein BY996DRAFT_7548366 [Phakopsora pachyrhizi]|nr:hypothetical protein BY996DRAFT_7872197 [Phakopsora pachyrhizi]KAI8448829.1 hypothetical protein BY996DRAFT_7548366 [Phakopsora pachyrhizi]